MRDKVSYRWLYIGLCIWAAAMVVAFYYFYLKPLQLFDQKGYLEDYSLSPNGREQLRDLLRQQFKLSSTDNKIVIHFSDPTCACQHLATLHINEIKRRFDQLNYRHLTFSTVQRDAHITQVNMPEWLPSLPAVAVLNENNELIYFGPYGGGAVCGANGSTIEWVVEQLEQQLPFSLVNYLEYGCFCEVEESAYLYR